MDIPRKLRRYADLIETPEAWDARRLRIALPLYQFFIRIRAYADIRTVLDVGANRGQFARWCAAVFPDAEIHAFEPLPDCMPWLDRLAAEIPRVRIHPIALGESAGSSVMYQNDYDPSSSMLPMLDRHREIAPKTSHAREIQVEVARLDDVARTRKFREPVFLKIDVQGFERSVLAGSREVLKSVAVAMMEVNLEPLYEGQTDLRELINFMDENGFRFLEFVEERRHPPHKTLCWADAAFVRKDLRRRSADQTRA